MCAHTSIYMHMHIYEMCPESIQPFNKGNGEMATSSKLLPLQSPILNSVYCALYKITHLIIVNETQSCNKQVWGKCLFLNVPFIDKLPQRLCNQSLRYSKRWENFWTNFYCIHYNYHTIIVPYLAFKKLQGGTEPIVNLSLSLSLHTQ